nr:hypothetical protein [Tanacetum cinerariifolium]
MKIDPHHFNVESNLIESLLNRDSLIISFSSSKIDSLLDEFAGELILLKLIPLGIDETDCDPEEEICLIKKLFMGDEHLDTIPAMESDEFIKSSVENFIDSLLDEFTGELTLHKSIPSGIDETDYHPENEIRLFQRLLYDNSSPRPPEEFVFENSYAEIESFSPSPIPIEDSDYPMEEIDLTFTQDDPMPPSIEEDDDDSRDILIREELLDNYSLSLPENESFHFDIPLSSRPPAKPPNGNTGILNIKMMGDVSDQKVHTPGLTITLVSNQEKSPDLLSHQGFENFQPSAKCPM